MRIVYAYPYTDEGGTEHKPDTTDDVTDEVAGNLINAGLARPADDTTSRKGGK